MNILEGTCDEKGQVTSAGIKIDTQIDPSNAGAISIGFRPEHIEIVQKASNKTLSGKLIYKENLGSDVFLHLSLDGSDDSFIVRAQPNEGNTQKIGDILHFTPIKGSALVFDSKGQGVTLLKSKTSRKRK